MTTTGRTSHRRPGLPGFPAVVVLTPLLSALAQGSAFAADDPQAGPEAGSEAGSGASALQAGVLADLRGRQSADPALSVAQPAEPRLQAGRVLFSGRSTRLDKRSTETLEAIAAALKASGRRALILGFGGDPAAKASQAHRLSLKRALAVRTHLVSLGVPESRIIVRAMGAARDSGPPHRADIAFSSA